MGAKAGATLGEGSVRIGDMAVVVNQQGCQGEEGKEDIGKGLELANSEEQQERGELGSSRARVKICASHDHVNHRCPVLKESRPAAHAVGYSVEGLGFYHIPHQPLQRGKKGSKIALVKVVGGMITKEKVVSTLQKVVSAKWKWEPIEQGDDSYMVVFPSKVELQRAIAFGGADVKENGAPTGVEIEHDGSGDEGLEEGKEYELGRKGEDGVGNKEEKEDDMMIDGGGSGDVGRQGDPILGEEQGHGEADLEEKVQQGTVEILDMVMKNVLNEAAQKVMEEEGQQGEGEEEPAERVKGGEGDDGGGKGLEVTMEEKVTKAAHIKENNNDELSDLEEDEMHNVALGHLCGDLTDEVMDDAENHLSCDMHNGIRVYKRKKYHNKLKKQGVRIAKLYKKDVNHERDLLE
uniref:DUF4283 domain-containing protein n=1 Tax=Oryza glumipatula TaxID=40148 RepID=A0A0E0BG32_9ORYZ